jgi:hypothetical protein
VEIWLCQLCRLYVLSRSLYVPNRPRNHRVTVDGHSQREKEEKSRAQIVIIAETTTDWVNSNCTQPGPTTSGRGVQAAKAEDGRTGTTDEEPGRRR